MTRLNEEETALVRKLESIAGAAPGLYTHMEDAVRLIKRLSTERHASNGVPGFEPTQAEVVTYLTAEMALGTAKSADSDHVRMPIPLFIRLLDGYTRTMLVATGRLGATEVYPRVAAKPEPEKAEAAE